jgi:hypothetical protein
MKQSSDASLHPGHLVYEIHARGALDQDWSSRLRGMRITVDRDHPHGPVTTLRGELPDEAALNGVLTTLYTLGLLLVSVEFSEPQDSDR